MAALSTKDPLLHWIAAGDCTGKSPTNTSTKTLRDNMKHIHSILSNDSVALVLLRSIHQRQQLQPTVRQASHVAEIAEEYETTANHFKAMNIIRGINLDHQQHTSLKRDIDALVHLSFVLGSETTHPNQLIHETNRVLQRNQEARNNFLIAHTEVLDMTRQHEEVDRLDKHLAPLRRQDLCQDGITDIVMEKEESSILNGGGVPRVPRVPRVDDLRMELKILMKKKIENEKKYMMERKKRKEIIDMYGSHQDGQYSWEELTQLSNEEKRRREDVDEKKEMLHAFHDLPPDFDLAIFRLAESESEFQTLEEQLNELQQQLAEEEEQHFDHDVITTGDGEDGVLEVESL